MRYPWANVLLLLFGFMEIASGFLGLLWGSPDRAIALQLHRIGGFAILFLLLWKWRNVLAPIRHARSWRRLSVPYTVFALSFALLLLVIALGLAWSHLGPLAFLRFSGLSWHIYLSVLLVPLVAWHAVFHGWNLRPRFWAGRRSFLRLSAFSLAGLFLWQTGELGAKLLGLPGSVRRFTGSYEAGSLSGNAFPVTSWLGDSPARADLARWRLKVHGLVAREREFTYEEVAQGQAKMAATLDCTGGWYSTQEWEGVPLRAILVEAGVRDGAASVSVRSVTGYDRRFSLAEADNLLLATRVGAEVLSHAHGFPLRLVAPGKRGYQWVKWVTAIEVNDTSHWWQSPLPLQ